MDMDWTSVALMGEKAGHEVISRSTTIVRDFNCCLYPGSDAVE
jgi:hypothetical protein